jgi:hypothetical protein
VFFFVLFGPVRDVVTGEQAGMLGAGTSAVAAGAMQAPTAGDAFTPELGLPGTDVVAFGASPQEHVVWAYGKLGAIPTTVAGQSYSEQYALLERTETSGWQVLPLPDREGKPLTRSVEAGSPAIYGALAGQATTAGGVVLLAGENIVVRDPGGQPQLVPPPVQIGAGSATSTSTSMPTGVSTGTGTPASTSAVASPGTSTAVAGEVLAPGESLLPPQASEGKVTVPYAAIEEESGGTGVLIAPHDDGGDSQGEPKMQPGVLHYDGSAWTREPIELAQADAERFTALALACGGTASATSASSPGNCWLLASAEVQTGSVSQTALLLFERERGTESGAYRWEREPVSDWLLGEASPPSGVSQRTVAPLAPGAQMLTVTAHGAWVDFQAHINGQGAPIEVSELLTPGDGEASTGPPPALPSAGVAGTWCYPAGVVCPAQRTLGAPLPERYRSFAWSGAGGEFGTRIVTGLPDGVMLELAGESFSPAIGLGEGSGAAAPGGAAFAPLQVGGATGLIAEGNTPIEGADGEGQSQAVEVGTQPPGDQLQEESVPFRRPLLAVAQAPGTTPGATSAEAIAVGVEGQIAHYTPGQGWRPESLFNSAGKAQTPNLRGVAWPEPTRAYAVGDEGAMWLWRSETGLWEPDPSEPFNFIGNLTAIAFSPSEPQRGYAVGKQGVLLRYGKSWEQEALPADLQQVNFTSVAFAGEEALATYRTIEPGTEIETGGLAIEDGSGWRIDPNAAALLERLPSSRERLLSKVAGLPDGGAVAAGPGLVIERDSSGAPWEFSSQPLPEAQNISALAAYREGSETGPVRAIISIDLNRALNPQRSDGELSSGESPFSVDYPPPTGSGQPTPFIGPDPLPDSGYMLKQAAGGWVDMEHAALPARAEQPGDMPVRPDPVLALLVDPTGDLGLAVGGQTGDAGGSGPNAADETSAALRFPAAAASVNGATPAAIPTPADQASFVVAGQAACTNPCEDFANESPGPDIWLAHALQTANRIASQAPGSLRAFLYTGSEGGEDVFSRELATDGGPVPAYAPGSEGAQGERPGPVGTGAYSFRSEGAGGPVEVFVLDFATGVAGSQEEWLSRELASLREQGVPAVVMGTDAPGNALARILVQEGASAYFFDSSGINVKAQISFGAASIPAYGSGTLGYVEAPGADETDSLGSSGYLLVSVDVAARNHTTNVAPVTAKVVPNIGQLALDATDGVLLRRSKVALFEALARRPTAGEEVAGSASHGGEIFAPDPYDQIPFNCQGPDCAEEVPMEYTFSSSKPDIGSFVEHEPGSSNPRQVELGTNKLPVPDSHSGLFCAYNEGTTIISITTGGLTFSEPVTVQGGSVEYPCGTVPLKNPPLRPAPASAAVTVPPLAPASPPPATPLVKAVAPPPPPAVVPTPPHQVLRVPPRAPFLFVPLAPSLLGAQPAIVPPISPPVARPIPPSGTAQVFESMTVPQREREREAAGELASNEFSAYDPNEGGGLAPWIVPLLILAAGAGVGVRRGVRPGRRRPALARAHTDSRRRRRR